jgi:hypothetical protein
MPTSPSVPQKNSSSASAHGRIVLNYENELAAHDQRVVRHSGSKRFNFATDIIRSQPAVD